MAKKLMQAKVVSGSRVISTAGKSAIIHAITLLSGTTDSSIIIKDGGSGGTEKWRLSLEATTAANEVTTSVSFGESGFICETDAFGIQAGTGSTAWVLYDEIED